MSLVDLRMTLEIILLVLNIAVLVENNFIKPKKHKKSRCHSRKDKQR